MIGWQAEQARRAHRIQRQADKMITAIFWGVIGISSIVAGLLLIGAAWLLRL